MLENEQVGPDRRLLLETVNIFARRWKLVCVLLLLAASGAYVQHVLFPKYVAQGSLIIRSDSNSPLLRAFGKITGAESDPYAVQNSPSDQMMKILRANEFGKFIERNVHKEIKAGTLPENLYITAARNNGKINVASHINANYNLKQSEDIIVIYGYSSNAEEAEAIAKWVTAAAQQYLIEYETREVFETEKYLRGEIDETNSRIEGLNAEVDKFRSDPNISTSSTEGYSGNVDRSIAKIREELEMVRVQSREIEILDKDYKDQIRSSSRSPDSVETQQEMQYMRGRVVDNIKDLAIQSEKVNAKEKALSSRLASLVGSLRPQNEQIVFNLKKHLELEIALRQELQRQVYATRIYQISAQNKIRLYESVLPHSAFRGVPLVKSFGLALFFAFALSLLAIFIWEHLYPVMSLKHDFVHNGVRLLGTLPNLFSKGPIWSARQHSKGMFAKMATVLQSGLRLPESTAVQFLAARILHNLEKHKGGRKGVLCVVSCNSGEGKTLISNCLSVALGSFGTKVLLVEGDTLRSSDENIFNIKPDIGFAEVLEKKAELGQVVKPTEFSNVFYLCRGMSRPALSLLQSQNYNDFLNQAREQFDIILIDTPAFAVGPEALFMAGQSDIGLVIATAHQTKQEAFAELAESLHARGTKNLYAIMNRSGYRGYAAEAYYYSDRLKVAERNAA